MNKTVKLMNRIGRRRICAAMAAVLLSTAVLTGCSEPEKDTEIVFTSEFAADEVFRIGETSCRVPEINVYVRTTQNQYETIFGSEILGKKVGGQTLESQLKEIVLGRLAQIKTMNLLAKQYSLSLSDDEEKTISEASVAFCDGLTDIEARELGVDQELIVAMYREYAMANKVFAEVTKDINPEISDDEARTVKVKAILLRKSYKKSNGTEIPMTEAEKQDLYAKAEKIESLLSEGEDFDMLAAKYSDDDQITYSFPRGTMPEEIEKVAFNLDNDEVSKIIETDYGYHILYCVSTLDRDETEASKVRMVEERKEEAFNDVYNEFVKTLYSNLNTDLWNSLNYDGPSDVTTTNFFDVFNEYFMKN